MGMMLTAVYQDGPKCVGCRAGILDQSDSPGEFDANGDGRISDDETDLLGLCCTSFGARIQERQRSWRHRRVAVEGLRQFQMRVDGLFTRLDAPTMGYHQSYFVEDSILDEYTGSHRWSDVSIRDHWVTGMSIADLVPEISTISEHRVVDTTPVRLERRLAGHRQLEVQRSTPTSPRPKRDSGGKNTWMVSGIAGSHSGHVDINRGGVPNISVTFEDGRDLATALQSGALGNADFGLHYIGLSGTDVTDEVTGLTMAAS